MVEEGYLIPFSLCVGSNPWAIGFTLSDLERVPFGIALPLREALPACRHSPPGCCDIEAYALVGRQDLAQRISQLVVWLRQSIVHYGRVLR
jgi:hypothetical protein